MKKSILLPICLFIILPTFCQSYMDPAQAYRMLKIQNDGYTYMQVGTYKVIGTPYLFGGKKAGSIYAKNEFGNSALVSYNIFSQQLEFTLDGKTTLVKEQADVDSFILRADGEYFFEDLFFVNASVIGSGEKCFFHLMSEGTKFNLYKKYSSKLEIVSTNYLQSELRQFSLSADFYYVDKANRFVKKLKLNKKAISTEFKYVRDLTNTLMNMDLGVETDKKLKSVFTILNQ